MDLEPLIRIYQKAPELHGLSHTMLGATLIAIPSIVLGKPASELLLRLSRWLVTEPDRSLIPTIVSWKAATVGGVVGTYSHVLIDSVMHSDVHLLAPWSQSSPLLDTMPVLTLHVVCLVLAVPGIVYAVGIYRRHRDRGA